MLFFIAASGPRKPDVIGDVRNVAYASGVTFDEQVTRRLVPLALDTVASRSRN